MVEVAEAANPQVGPGAGLRSARESHQLSVRDVARSLRLDPAIIEALEADDFARLPAPIFIKGYLSAYCKLLALSPQESIAAYERAVGGVKPPPLVVSKGTGDDVGTTSGGRWVGWTVLLLVIVMVALWWIARPESLLPTEEPSATVVAPVLLPAPPPQAINEDPVETVEETPEASEAALVEDPLPTPIPGNLRVRLAFTDDCWTEVVDQRGDRLFFDLAAAGRTVEIEGLAPIQVFLGNAPAVTIEVNGQPFDHKRYNRTGNVARFQIGDEAPGTNP